MLRNKTNKPVAVRYNSIDLVIEPGAMLDVLDFNVTSKTIPGVELHIEQTHPNVFERIDRKAHGLTEMEASKKIRDLETRLENVASGDNAQKKTIDDLSEQLNVANNTIHALEKENGELVKEVNNLEAKIKSKDFRDQ